MKVTVLMWLMPQWISYRWVVYLLTSGHPNDSASVYKNSISHFSLTRNSHNTIWQPLFPKGACSSDPKDRRKWKQHQFTWLYSRHFSCAFGVSRHFRALSDSLVRSLLRSPRLSPLFIRFCRFSCVVVVSRRFSCAVGDFSCPLGGSCKLLCVLVVVVVLVWVNSLICTLSGRLFCAYLPLVVI